MASGGVSEATSDRGVGLASGNRSGGTKGSSARSGTAWADGPTHIAEGRTGPPLIGGASSIGRSPARRIAGMAGMGGAAFERGASANNSGRRRAISSAMDGLGAAEAADSLRLNSRFAGTVGGGAGSTSNFFSGPVGAETLAGDLADGRDFRGATDLGLVAGLTGTAVAGSGLGTATAGSATDFETPADGRTTGVEGGVGVGKLTEPGALGRTNLAAAFFAAVFGATGAGNTLGGLATAAAGFFTGRATTAGAGAGWATFRTTLPTDAFANGGSDAGRGSFETDFGPGGAGVLAVGAGTAGAAIGLAGTLGFALALAWVAGAASGTGLGAGRGAERDAAGAAKGAWGFRAKGGSGAGGDGRFRDFGVMRRNPTDGGGCCRRRGACGAAGAPATGFPGRVGGLGWLVRRGRTTSGAHEEPSRRGRAFRRHVG